VVTEGLQAEPLQVAPLQVAPLQVAVVTIFPEMLDAVTAGGIPGRAAAAGLLRVVCVNPRDFAADRHRTVDDRPYGGGPGMVMTAPPLVAAVRAARAAVGGDRGADGARGAGAGDAGDAGGADAGGADAGGADAGGADAGGADAGGADAGGAVVLYLSPQGRRLDQAGVAALAGRRRLVLLCGRYEGVDERVVEEVVDEEWSIGDFVLSGGEPAAIVLLDAMTRLLPGALGHEDSAREDSFAGGLLDCPHYTRPEAFAGRRVPEVLLSGNHAEIRRWRAKQAIGRTWLRRPDLVQAAEPDETQRALLEEFLAERRERGRESGS